VDQALQAKRAASDTRTSTGRVGIAVVVRNGAPAPQIATPENLRQAALAADALVFNTAGSGQAVQRMFDAMGILAQIQPRVTRPTNAAETMDRILQGKGAELGFGLLSEIKPYEMKGIRVVGPLPDALQSYINYEGIASDSSSLSNTARTFLRYIGTPAARQVFARTGVD